MNTKELLKNLPKEMQENNILAKVGRGSFAAASFLIRWKPLLSIGLNLLILLAISAFPVLAQPNPWGGSGTTRLANAGNNLLVLGTWFCGIVGIISFLVIAYKIMMEKPYLNYVISGIVGVGGFAIMGAIAYDIVNLSSMEMPDPTIGN